LSLSDGCSNSESNDWQERRAACVNRLTNYKNKGHRRQRDDRRCGVGDKPPLALGRASREAEEPADEAGKISLNITL
jgi:hypothetical protein